MGERREVRCKIYSCVRNMTSKHQNTKHHITLETPNTGSANTVVRGQPPHFCVFYHFSWFQRTWLHPPSCTESRDPTFDSWWSKTKLLLNKNVSRKNCLLWYLVSTLTSWTFPSTWDDWFLHNTASPGQTCSLAPTDLHTFKNTSRVLSYWQVTGISQNVGILRIILVLSPLAVRQHGATGLTPANVWEG